MKKGEEEEEGRITYMLLVPMCVDKHACTYAFAHTHI